MTTPTQPATTSASAGAVLDVLWANTRIVVVDTETCVSPDGGHRVVSIAAVTCRDGITAGSWSNLVDPGVPIDHKTTQIHGITDRHVTGEPDFGQLAGRLVDQLTADDGELVVLAAHNAPFDIGVLHAELDRTGHTLPDVWVADTSLLPAHLGVRTPDRKLPTILGALGLNNPAHHDAASDAGVTAQALIALLEVAAEQGHTDLRGLLRDGGDGRHRTSLIRQHEPGSTRATGADDGWEGLEADAVQVPAAHAAGHTTVLPADPTDDELNVWQQQITDCVQLRCAMLTDRVAATRGDPKTVRQVLERHLDRTLTDRDPAGVATVLGALGPLLADLPDRDAALNWWDRRAQAIADVGRCTTTNTDHDEDDEDDEPEDNGVDGDEHDRRVRLCPPCRTDQPCPVDVFHQQLAEAALEEPRKAQWFLLTSGKTEGQGVFITWKRDGRHRLADHTAWLAYCWWADTKDQPTRADKVARYAYQAGGLDPRLVAAHARNVAAAGTDTALEDAVDICTDTLTRRGGDTDPAWRQLVDLRRKYSGRLRRIRPRTKVDADGNPVPVRRHHPVEPIRARPMRFKS